MEYASEGELFDQVVKESEEETFYERGEGVRESDEDGRVNVQTSF